MHIYVNLTQFAIVLATILEICRILHEKGHTIQFACLEGQQKLVASYDFISKIHVVGRAVTPEDDAEIHKLRGISDLETSQGRSNQMAAFRRMMSWWPETYVNLKDLCTRERPDFIFSEALCDASVDVASQLQIPIAMNYPQIPSIPESYIPGMAGFPLKHLTSEHASLWDRMEEELGRLKLLWAGRHFALERRRMQVAAGMKPTVPRPKPNYLLFTNQFFGLEVPRHLPPLVHPVGPILPEDFTRLSEGDAVTEFLQTHSRVIFIAFGTHIITPEWRKRRLIDGISTAIKAGHLDGVIWAMKTSKDPEGVGEDSPNKIKYDKHPTLDYASVLGNQDPNWLIAPWVEQRAILDHPSTSLFLSHCGTGSVMETVVHGVPVIGMPFFGDQPANCKRLVAAGVAIGLHKDRFTAEELQHAIGEIMQDADGVFSRNILRLRRIAHVNTQRKFLAAQLIEEVMYDHELRFEYSPHETIGSPHSDQNSKESLLGNELRPMHLQTCDMRMSWFKQTNWDMWLLFPLYLPALIARSLF